MVELSQANDRPYRAFVAMLLAQLCFSGNILLIRLAERAEIASGATQFRMRPWEPMFLRSIALAILCYALLWHHKPRKLSPKENAWLWARGTAGVLSLSAYYYGMLHIPLGMASLFSNSSPLYVTVLALVIGHETLSRWRGAALFFGFLGICLVGLGAKASSQTLYPWQDILIAMLSGPLSAAAYFSIRMLKNVRNEQIMLSLGLSGSILGLLMILWTGATFPLSTQAWVWLILSIVPAVFAQLFLTLAFRLAPATQVAPLQYSAPLFSGVLGYLYLRETIPFLSLCGMAIVILFGLFLPFLEEKRRRRPEVSP